MPDNIGETITQFADDTTILLKVDDNLKLHIQSILDDLSEWFISNKMEINIGKTLLMPFGTINQIEQNNALSLSDSVTLEVADSSKFLGLTLDCKLKWDKQIDEICTKLTSIIYLLLQLRQRTDGNSIKIAYHGLFHSVMSYGLVFWGGNERSLERVFLLQKRAMRTMYRLGILETCKPIFINEKILTAPSAYIFQICIMVHQGKISLRTPSHSYPTRHKNDFMIDQFRNKCHRTGIDSMSAKIYNKLPPDIKEISNLKTFKNSLKKLLINEAFYNVSEFLGGGDVTHDTQNT